MRNLFLATLVAIIMIGVPSAHADGFDNRSTEDVELLEYLGFYVDPDPAIWVKSPKCTVDAAKFWEVQKVAADRILCSYFHVQSREFILSVMTANSTLPTSRLLHDMLNMQIREGNIWRLETSVPEYDFRFASTGKTFGKIGEKNIIYRNSKNTFDINGGYMSYLRVDWLKDDDILIMITPSAGEPAETAPMLENVLNEYFHFSW